MYVDPTIEMSVVVLVFPIVIAQLDVFRDAEMETSVTTDTVFIEATIEAVVVTTSQFARNHVPLSFATMQLTVDFPAGAAG